MKVLLNQRDRHAAFSYRRRNAFHRAEPHIATGENTGDTGFKEIGITTLSPPAGLHNIIASQDIASCISGDVRRQPFGFRISADEDENAAAVASA